LQQHLVGPDKDGLFEYKNGECDRTIGARISAELSEKTVVGLRIDMFGKLKPNKDDMARNLPIVRLARVERRMARVERTLNSFIMMIGKEWGSDMFASLHIPEDDESGTEPTGSGETRRDIGDTGVG
jgi:hypothetical protein